MTSRKNCSGNFHVDLHIHCNAYFPSILLFFIFIVKNIQQLQSLWRWGSFSFNFAASKLHIDSKNTEVGRTKKMHNQSQRTKN